MSERYEKVTGIPKTDLAYIDKIGLEPFLNPLEIERKAKILLEANVGEATREFVEDTDQFVYFLIGAINWRKRDYDGKKPGMGFDFGNPRTAARLALSSYKGALGEINSVSNVKVKDAAEFVSSSLEKYINTDLDNVLKYFDDKLSLKH